METVTLDLNQESLDKMQEFYEEFICSIENPYVLFFARIDECVITAYKSGKVVFQGEDAQDEAMIWSEIKATPQAPVSSWKIDIAHIGSDEVGTGDYFGPITVAACYVSKEDIIWLKSLGVDDSKKLSDEKIRQIAPLLINRLTYSQMAIDNIKFNEMTQKGYNMNKLKAILHNAVLNNVINKKGDFNCPKIIDQFAEEKLYYSYLTEQNYIVRGLTFETKAESSYPAVASASIIARYSFLTKMDELSKRYGCEIPKGASMVVDTFGELFVRLYGLDELNKIAKINFKNTEKIKALLGRFKG